MTRRRVLASEQEADVVARYKKGDTIDEIATSFGVSSAPVRRALTEAGVPFRRRSWRPLEVDVDAVVSRYAEGESMLSIAHALGVGEKTVRRRLLDARVTLRPRGQGNRRV